MHLKFGISYGLAIILISRDNRNIKKLLINTVFQPFVF